MSDGQPDAADFPNVLELLRSNLKPQLLELLARILEHLLKVVNGSIFQFFKLKHSYLPINLVFIGSL